MMKTTNLKTVFLLPLRKFVPYFFALSLIAFAGCKKEKNDPPPPPPPPPPAALIITGFSPASGAPGTVVTISGSGFNISAAANTVNFNGVAAVVTLATTSSITVTVPATATTGKISVQNGSLSFSSLTDFTVTTLATQKVLSKMVSSYLYTSGDKGQDSSSFIYNNLKKVSTIQVFHTGFRASPLDLYTYVYDVNGKVKEAVLGNTGRYVYFPTSEKPDSVQNFSNNNLSAVNKYIYESNKIISNIYTYNGPTQTYYGNRTFVTNLSNNVESLTFNYTSTSIYNYTYDDKKGISKLVGVIVPDIFTFDFSFESYLTANNIIGRTSSGTPGANYSAVYTYDADGYPLTRNVIFETGNKVNTVYKYEIL